MNFVEAFATYVAGISSTTLGQNIFIGQAPSSNKVPDSIIWVVDNGGGVIKKNSTGESTKRYQIDIFCRDRNYKTVKDTLFLLEEKLNCDGCSQINGYDTIDIEATTFPVDVDLDSEDRQVGLLQVNIMTYKECE